MLSNPNMAKIVAQPLCYSHSQLVERAASWLRNTANCGFVATEIVANTTYGEQPDAIGFRAGGVSILIECKVSRGDFLADAKKQFREKPQYGIGMYRFYMCPEGIIAPTDLPEKWGLLVVGKRKLVTRVCGGSQGNIWDGRAEDCFTERNTKAEWEIMYSALRRLT